MIDAYAIGVRLEMDNRGISSQIRNIATQFEQLQKLGKEFGKESVDTSKAIKVIGDTSRNAAALVRQMSDAMKSYNVHAKVAVSLAEKLGTTADNQAVKARKELDRQADRQERLARKQASDAERMARREADMARERQRREERAASEQQRMVSARERSEARAAAQSQQAWERSYEAIKMRAARVNPFNGSLSGITSTVNHYARGAIEDSVEYNRLMTNMQLNRGRPEDKKMFDDAAKALSASHPDMSRLDAMHMYNETVGMVTPERAIELGPQLADVFTRLKQAYHGEMPENVMQAFLKFAEEGDRIYGKDGKVDKNKIAEASNIFVEAIRRSGGMATPQMLVDAMRYSGGLARTMSGDALMQYLEGQVITMRGAGTGTSLESMASGVLRGKLNRDQMRFLRATDNLDMGKVTRDPHSGMYELQNGAFKSLPDMMENPFQWNIDQIEKYAKLKGITKEEAIYRIYPRERSRRGATQLLNNEQMSAMNYENEYKSLLGPNNENAQRDAQGNITMRRNGTPMLDHAKANEFQAKIIREQSQGNQIDQFTKALQNLSVVLGNEIFQSGVGVLGYFTQKLRDFTKWAEDNPKAMKEAIDTIAGTLETAGLGAALLGLSVALGPFAVGMVAFKALEAMTGEKGIPALAKAIDGLFKAFEKMPAWMIRAAVGAYAGNKILGKAGVPLGAVGGALFPEISRSLGLTSGEENAPGSPGEPGAKPETGGFWSSLAMRALGVGGGALTGWRLGGPYGAAAGGLLGSGIPGDFWDFFMGDKSPAQRGQETIDRKFNDMQSGTDPSNPVQQQSFVPPAGTNTETLQPINLVLNNEVLGRSVIRILGKEASKPSRGYSGFDTRANPLPPGALTA